MRKTWVLTFLIAMGLAGTAAAQNYPTRAVRIIVPYAAGGGVDVVARVLGAGLTNLWGKPVIVDNRTGAGSLIGTEAVARSNPDGYTLLATTSQTFSTNRFVYKSLPYDPDRSLVPITLLVQGDQFILASEAVPAKDLKELVALARQKGSNLTYGSWGVGSEPQLTYEQLKSREKIDIVHVPYRGVAPVLTALTAGEIQLSVGSVGVAGPLMRAGKLKPLAVASNKRSPHFPNVPTTVELGYPYMRAAIVIALFAPAGTPADVLEKIGRDVHGLLKSPAFEKEIASRGYDVAPSTPEELTAKLKEETARVAEVVQAANIKPE